MDSLKEQIIRCEKKLAALKAKLAIIEAVEFKPGTAVFHKQYGQVLIRSHQVKGIKPKETKLYTSIIDSTGEFHDVPYSSLAEIGSMSQVLYEKEP